MMNHYQTETEITALVNQFRSQTLPSTAWTHQAHLTVGLWFVKNYSFEEAVCYLRGGIITYNYSVGGQNTPQKGYHETLTLFWAKIIAQFIHDHIKLNLLDLCNAFLESEMASKELPLKFYTPNRVFSTSARAFWIEPDLQTLDISS
ncbi:MAG: hypothetical protein NW226_15650 [Microscillaceae bacterium]|nr:hypothetical protein [Microscillaceae bacterium]